MSGTEWTTVKTRTRTHRGPRISKSKNNVIGSAVIVDNCKDDDLDTVVMRIRHAQNAIAATKYYRDCVSIMKSNIQTEYDHVVMLGIGNFSKSNAALLQLSFGLELAREFQMTSPSIIYDPVMLAFEIDICLNMGLVLGVNELDIHTASSCTLFYMPHCPYLLYTQVLWTNWGELLNNVKILGNRYTMVCLN